MTDTHGTHANEAARDIIPNARDLAPEGREASSFFHAVIQEFTTLSPVVIDLCRLKSAKLNECMW